MRRVEFYNFAKSPAGGAVEKFIGKHEGIPNARLCWFLKEKERGIALA